MAEKRSIKEMQEEINNLNEQIGELNAQIIGYKANEEILKDICVRVLMKLTGLSNW